MLTLPTTLGTSGMWIETRTRARRSSQTPTATAAMTTTSISSLRRTREPMMRAPRPRPTPIAAGRLRPARDGAAGARVAPASSVPGRCSRRALRDSGEDMVVSAASPSDLEELGLLALEQLVHGVDVPLGGRV